MAGALIGSIVGLLILHLLVQERALMIAVVALLAGAIIYIQQGARHPYAWLFGGFSLVLLTFGNAAQPEDAFEAAVAWVSGNALGITIVLVMHGVLWPHTGEKQFHAQLRTILRDSVRLFTLKVSSALQGEAPAGDLASKIGRYRVRSHRSHAAAAPRAAHRRARNRPDRRAPARLPAPDRGSSGPDQPRSSRWAKA